MGKKIINETINNPNDIRELSDVYLYELLAGIEITKHSISKLFDLSYKDIQLNSRQVIQIQEKAKRKLIDLKDHIAYNLMRKGYDLSEYKKGRRIKKHPMK